MEVVPGLENCNKTFPVMGIAELLNRHADVDTSSECGHSCEQLRVRW